MIPYIRLPVGEIPSFVVFAASGVIAFFIALHILLRHTNNRIAEENYIFPKVVASGVVGFLSAGVLDSLFKIKSTGSFQLGGMTFYGGLIGSVICIAILIRFSKGKTQYSLLNWLNLLSKPFVIFHILGRTGCFFGGCCYGKNTRSAIGIVFPDQPDIGIFHYGMKCYPTQLFEIAALLIILFVLFHVKNQFYVYLILYSTSRFIIEFFRGDDRGFLIRFLSPAQLISVLLFLLAIIRLYSIQRRTVSEETLQ